MSDRYYVIKKSTLEDIANAIRTKTGTTDLIKVSDFDDNIEEITGSGSGGSSSTLDKCVLS